MKCKPSKLQIAYNQIKIEEKLADIAEVDPHRANLFQPVQPGIMNRNALFFSPCFWAFDCVPCARNRRSFGDRYPSNFAAPVAPAAPAFRFKLELARFETTQSTTRLEETKGCERRPT